MLLDDNEFLIIKESPYLTIKLLNKQNLLEEISLDYNSINKIDSHCRKCEKNDAELGDDLSIYIKPFIRKKKVIPVTKTFSADQINMLFNYLDEIKTITLSDKDIEDLLESQISLKSNISITQEDEIREECTNIINRLLGYKLTIFQDGDHKNDGQLVDYTLLFESTTGEKTIINTEMCLMCSWNHYRNEIIK